MARAVSRIPGVTAIIVPYDIVSRIAQARQRFDQPDWGKAGEVGMRMSRDADYLGYKP